MIDSLVGDSDTSIPLDIDYFFLELLYNLKISMFSFLS